MSLIIAYEVIFILVLLVLSGFMSGSETALTSLSRSSLEKLMEAYPRQKANLLIWKNSPNRMLAVTLIGTNFFNTGMGVMAASLAFNVAAATGWDKKMLLFLVPGVVTALILLFGEMLPKIIGRHKSERFSVFAIGALVFLLKNLNSFISALVWISDALIKSIGGRGVGDKVFLNARELKTIFSAAECRPSGADANHCTADARNLEIGLSQNTRAILRNILTFSETTVGEIMTPRTRMFAVNLREKTDNIIRLIYAQGYSRVPVYEKSIDNIVGVIFAKDLLNAWRNRSLIIVQDIIRPAYFVPEHAPLTELFREFKKGNHHLAVVVDEYGGTSGVVTVEDALEEIIGEIYDEYDERVSAITKESDSSWVVMAGESLDRVNETLGIDLPADKHDNMAAFVLKLFGKLPKKGDAKHYQKILIEVADADRKRVLTVRIRKTA